MLVYMYVYVRLYIQLYVAVGQCTLTFSFALDFVYSDGDLTPDKPVDTLEDSHLYDIAQDVGADWMVLSRRLGIDETTIQSIRQTYSHDLREAAYQAFLK